MAKITRATQQIFGENAISTEVTAFGTAMTNNPIFTKDPAQLQTAASLLGWSAAIESDMAPFEEDTNGLCYLITRQLAYLYQQGTPEWDSDTTYYKNSLCTVIENNNLIIKRSLTDDNTGNNPLTDNVNWADYFSQRVIHTIGDPIITLNPVLQNNEIWLEGATVSRTTYSNLFQIYGTTYGAGNGSTTFKLPDFRNRAIWGASGFGYLSAGIPNITGQFRITETNGDCSTIQSSSGAFRNSGAVTGGEGHIQITNNQFYQTVTIDASRSSGLYGSSSTVQPPAIKVRVKTRYQ